MFSNDFILPLHPLHKYLNRSVKRNLNHITRLAHLRLVLHMFLTLVPPAALQELGLVQFLPLLFSLQRTKDNLRKYSELRLLVQNQCMWCRLSGH